MVESAAAEESTGSNPVEGQTVLCDYNFVSQDESVPTIAEPDDTSESLKNRHLANCSAAWNATPPVFSVNPVPSIVHRYTATDGSHQDVETTCSPAYQGSEGNLKWRRQSVKDLNMRTTTHPMKVGT